MASLRMTQNRPKEQEEQLALFRRMECSAAKHPVLAYVFHTPNGAFLGANRERYGRLLALLGVRRGVPDVCCPVPMDGYNGLWIELKRIRFTPSEVDPAQTAYHEFLRSHGHRVEVCGGWIAAWNTLCEYLHIEGETVQ